MLERFDYYLNQAQTGHTVGWIQVVLLSLACIIFLLQGIRLSLIDVREHRLPDRIVLPTFACLAVLLYVIVILDQDFLRARNLAYSAIFLFGSYWILRKASRNSLGFGDVKLAGVIGLICGFLAPLHMLWATLFAFLLGGGVSVFLMATRRAQVTSHIPFGPFMILGAFIALLIPA